MNYNDFQIFNNETYSLLNSKFFSPRKTERKDFAQKLYLELSSCLYLCFSKNNYNKKICENIKTIKNFLEQIIDNLKANFSLFENAQNIYHDFNLFIIIKKLLNSLLICSNWLKQEEKEYYKQFLNNLIVNLIDLILNLNSSLEKSTIKIFKFM